MVKYLDKEVGMLVHKLDSMQLDKNTIIIFTGDNGTEAALKSMYQGTLVQGGKGF